MTSSRRRRCEHYLRQLPAVLRQHANYRRFLVGYALLRLSMMAVSFFIVFATISLCELSGADIGLLNAIFIGTQAVMRLLIRLAGRPLGAQTQSGDFSHASMALAAVIALGFSEQRAGSDSGLHLPGLRHFQRYVSHFNIVLEFATPADQPTFIGLTNTLMAPFTFAGPIFCRLDGGGP